MKSWYVISLNKSHHIVHSISMFASMYAARFFMTKISNKSFYIVEHYDLNNFHMLHANIIYRVNYFNLLSRFSCIIFKKRCFFDNYISACPLVISIYIPYLFLSCYKVPSCSQCLTLNRNCIIYMHIRVYIVKRLVMFSQIRTFQLSMCKMYHFLHPSVL